ncbi:IS66 family insertion sequence element accessory protein TnpB [Candidatus Woesearchaeota archaeon]|nr:IS66 family insertion sequence element accessory protein TnpB [Candidatus Woesearchaeota archaeon]
MLKLESFTGIYLHRDRVDFRKSIDGLSAIVEQEMGLNVFGSHLFLFCNKNRTRLKVLYWDATGFAMWYKRLEQDRFRWPRNHDDEVILIDAQQFEWLLGGYDIWKMKPHEKVNYSRIS